MTADRAAVKRNGISYPLIPAKAATQVFSGAIEPFQANKNPCAMSVSHARRSGLVSGRKAMTAFDPLQTSRSLGHEEDMIRIDGHFDALHTTESTFGKPTVSDSTLTIPALKLVLLGDHPLANRGWIACAGELIFTDVALSRRELVPYRGDPGTADGFLPPIHVSDPIPRPRTNGERSSFLFEGFYAGEPLAWISEWEVQAGACHLLVPEDGERPLYGPC